LGCYSTGIREKLTHLKDQINAVMCSLDYQGLKHVYAKDIKPIRQRLVSEDEKLSPRVDQAV